MKIAHRTVEIMGIAAKWGIAPRSRFPQQGVAAKGQAMNGKVKLEAGVTLGSSDYKEVGNLSKAQYLLYGKAVLRHQEPGEMLKGATIFPVTGEYDLTLAATDSDEQIVKLNGKLVTSGGASSPDRLLRAHHVRSDQEPPRRDRRPDAQGDPRAPARPVGQRQEASTSPSAGSRTSRP